VPDTPAWSFGRPSRRIPECRFNIVVLHGEVEGMSGLRHERRSSPTARATSRRRAGTTSALGHYHVHQKLAENMYLLRLDRLHVDEPVGRALRREEVRRDGKGFVERDLVTGEHTFHSLPTSRDHIDLRSTPAG
jgi:hypothetical protein